LIKKNTQLKEVLKLASPCKCGSCNNGCRFGSGALAEGDLRKIADHLGISKQRLKKEYLREVELFNKKVHKPRLLNKKDKVYGKCIFFDEKIGCKIHQVKPLECRTSIQCKDYGQDLSLWFMLNHIIDFNDPEAVRQYANYIKSGGKTLKDSNLSDVVPDKAKLKRILNYELLK
jgi:Fe-S-cluster containining protein